jgi:hypothetical protein
MTYKFLGLLVGGVALLSGASPAMAANVSVEIEGLSQTQAPKLVQTPASVIKDGTNRCDGDTAIGALDAATGGNWSGSYSYNNYTVETLLGEAHPFGSGGYWSIYVNGKFGNGGACDIHVTEGDKLLFYASDDPYTAGVGGYDEPVLIDAPTTATPGQTLTVKVSETTTDFNQYPSPSTIAPSSGATVAYGDAVVPTGADGTAKVTISGPGPYTLRASKGNRAPALLTGCATTGTDGYCGTSTSGGGQPTSVPAAPCTTNGHDGFCGTKDTFAAYGRLLGITEGKKYKNGQGPRQLAGRIEDDASGLADVRVRLTRRNGEACSTYDAKRERFKAIKKCGASHGTWFSVGAKSDWTYLLPSRLGRGRYVLDLQVVDKAGNKTTKLARGTSRVVFTVA